MVEFLKVDLLDEFDGFDLLHFGLEVGLDFLLHAVLEGYVEVGLVGEEALDEFAVLAPEEAQHGHAFFVVVLAILEGLGFEVGEEGSHFAIFVVVGYTHFLLVLFPLVPYPLLDHDYPPI